MAQSEAQGAIENESNRINADRVAIRLASGQSHSMETDTAEGAFNYTTPHTNRGSLNVESGELNETINRNSTSSQMATDNPLPNTIHDSDRGNNQMGGTVNAKTETANSNSPPLPDRDARVFSMASSPFRVGKFVELGSRDGQAGSAGEIVPHVELATCGEPVNPLSTTRPTRGKPTVEFGKSSKFTWQFRLRWNSEPGRPVIYVATVADSTFEMIRSGNYDDYKRQLIADYEARTFSADQPA